MTNYLDILWDAFALFVLWPLPAWIFLGIIIASIVIAWRVGRRGRASPGPIQKKVGFRERS